MQTYQISNKKPAVYQQCQERFGVNWNKGIIITYGDTIYCKFKVHPQKIAHETVHIKQQSEYGVEAWWVRYFEDIRFRLDQEAEAYAAEVIWIQKNVKNFRDMAKRIDDLSVDLSSFTYGNIISKEKALKLILK